MFFKKKETSYQVEVTNLKDPILAVGISIDTDQKTSNKDISKLGSDFASIKDSILNKAEPWKFLAISKDVNQKTGAFNYFMGDVVTSFEGQPDHLETLEVPNLIYAKITVKPKSRMAWGLEIIKVKKYFYSEWLPNSKYKQARGIDAFEVHDERSKAKKPEMDMYFAIKRK